jgi:hypothetical protein
MLVVTDGDAAPRYGRNASIVGRVGVITSGTGSGPCGTDVSRPLSRVGTRGVDTLSEAAGAEACAERLHKRQAGCAEPRM